MYNQDDERNRHQSYYSYGPYHTRDEVEVIPPRPVPQPTVKTKKSGFAGKFWSFLLGGLLIGGLMFAADASDLFTGDEQALTPYEDTALTPDESEVQTASTNRNASNVNTSSGGGVVRPADIASIVARTSNAIVKIETTVPRESMFDNPMFEDQWFERFFGDSFDGEGGGEQEGGMGSGFIFDKQGFILTNEHVIEGADKIYVKLKGSDKKYPAKLLGTAVDLDLAVLKIEGRNDFPTLKLGSSDAAQVGDWVIAIGNPYGFEHTVTVGVLSAKERPISIPDSKSTREYKNLLQTDASINPGNSGGPLLNLRGEVIGINTAVSAQAQGIGFAIPTSTVNSVLEALKTNKKIVKAYMGVRLQNLDANLARELGLSNTDGSIIVQVENNGPAAQAGLEPYDVILSVNGKKIKDTQALQDTIQAQKPGNRIKLVIQRNGAKWSATVILGKMETGLVK
jgi:serine protease Do